MLSLCVCLDVNQGGTNCNRCNLACTDLLINPIAHQELGQCDLLYGSQSLAEKGGHELASCSQLSVTVHGLLVISSSQ